MVPVPVRQDDDGIGRVAKVRQPLGEGEGMLLNTAAQVIIKQRHLVLVAQPIGVALANIIDGNPVDAALDTREFGVDRCFALLEPVQGEGFVETVCLAWVQVTYVVQADRPGFLEQIVIDAVLPDAPIQARLEPYCSKKPGRSVADLHEWRKQLV